jgi:hypothetical protein
VATDFVPRYCWPVWHFVTKTQSSELLAADSLWQNQMVLARPSRQIRLRAW